MGCRRQQWPRRIPPATAAEMEADADQRGPIFANKDEQGGIRQIPDGLMLGCSGVDFEQAKTAAAAGGGAFTSDLQGAKIVDLVTVFSCLTANCAYKY